MPPTRAARWMTRSGRARSNTARTASGRVRSNSRLRGTVTRVHPAASSRATTARPTNPGQAVLEIGNGTGDVLEAVSARRGVGCELSPAMAAAAARAGSRFEFCALDNEEIPLDERFDAIVVSGVIGDLTDVQAFLRALRRLSTRRTRLYVDHYNPLWQPLVTAAERLGAKMPQPDQNWLTPDDIENLLTLAGFEVIRRDRRLLAPKYVPLLSTLCNRVLGKLPLLRRLC